jgi:hypothetical protein
MMSLHSWTIQLTLSGTSYEILDNEEVRSVRDVDLRLSDHDVAQDTAPIVTDSAKPHPTRLVCLTTLWIPGWRQGMRHGSDGETP